MTDDQARRFWNWMRRSKRLHISSYQARLIFDYVERNCMGELERNAAAIARFRAEGESS